MIRTGYLRWEIEANEGRCPGDPWSRQVTFSARPTYRTVRVKWTPQSTAEQRFVQGAGTYDEVLAAIKQGALTSDIEIPNVGPHVWKYNDADRNKLFRYWFQKLQREANTFAHQVVRVAGSFPQLVIANPVLRANYARMVEHEIMRVIDGKSKAKDTIIDEFMELDVTQYQSGVPELVAAELVRDVFEPEHFQEFSATNQVTLKSHGKKYRISRRTHALVDVWDENGEPEAGLCIVFKDPGMPPSDEVVMKYLLVKHDPETLWNIAVKFPPRPKAPGAD